MSKAYDKVEWAFEENLMLSLGFYSDLAALVMSCVKTVSYFVLLNGNQV